MQKFLHNYLYLSLLFASLIFFSGCQDGSTDIIDAGDAHELVGSVWAGETPREGDWLTITFRENNRVTMSFTYDDTTNDWQFTYRNNEGTFITDGWNPAPQGFTVNGDTLSIVNFGNHAPNANPPVVHTFQRYR